MEKITLEDYIKEAVCDWLLDNNHLEDLDKNYTVLVKNGNVYVGEIQFPKQYDRNRDYEEMRAWRGVDGRDFH